MLKRLFKTRAAQAITAALLGRYLAAVAATTRWSLDGEAHLVAADQAVVWAFWHERLPLMPALAAAWRRRHPDAPRPHVLISRHRDGRLIAAAMERFGLATVDGSSRRGAAAALRTLLRLLADGIPVVITPDGPRGPRRQAAPGVAQLAALAGVPVLPCAARTARVRVLGSWDRMLLPLPFGRGVLVVGAPIAVARDGARAALPAIEAALTAACERADTLVTR